MELTQKAQYGRPQLSTFEVLEPRVLFSATLVESALHDHHDHDHDDSGPELHVLPPVDAGASIEEVPGISDTGDSPYLQLAPLSETFLLNSNPGANHTIYLDFDGHTTSGTIWNNNFNGGADFTTPVYSFEGDASFSNNELTRIQNIWQRVAEDFIPFDVNVTTQDPGLDALIKSGSTDAQWGVRVPIGGSSYDWFGQGAGGVAYVGSFNWNTDTPTYVFTDQLGNGNEKYTAEAASHEAGHTLGLRHDGTSTEGYYTGHGSGETGWAPIMGVGYYKNLSQWSKGEYNDASRTEDDLAIITGQNGFGYRVDDHSSSLGSASALTTDGTSVSATGLIERNTDFDVFSFTTGSGSVSLNIDPAARGANLDILAELLDSNGSVIGSSNPLGDLSASINENLSAGTYFLRISGTGEGDPSGTGYSDYGSLGQYSINGTVQPASTDPTLSIGDVTVDEAAGTATFTVSLSEASDSTVSVTAATGNGSATAGSDYVGTSETLVFNPGETSKTFTVSIIDDSVDESNESFVVNLSDASGAVISDGQGLGTIVDNDVTPVFVSIGDASVTEPDIQQKGKNKGTPKTTNMSFTVNLSTASSETVSVDWSTVDGTALAGIDYTAAAGTVVFGAGQTSATISVEVIGDVAIEGNEQFTIQLANVTNASISDASAIGTIIDNDSGGGDGGGGGGGNGKGNGKGPNKAFAIDSTYSMAAYSYYSQNLTADDSEDEAEEEFSLFESVLEILPFDMRISG